MNIRILAASAVLAGALVSTAQAEENRTPTEVHVSMAGVDFSQPASVDAFYGHLRAASREACDSHLGRDLSAAMADRKCAAQALDRAVAQINRPTLLALHAQRTGQKPATLFAAN